MTMPQINTDLFEAKLDRATPGESLTNDPDAPYSFEKPPEFTTIHAASEYIFERVTDEDNYMQFLKTVADGASLMEITKVLLFEMYNMGKINPDLLVLLIEPTVYILMALCERADVDFTIDGSIGEEEELDNNSSEYDILKRLQASRGSNNTPLPEEIEQRLQEIRPPPEQPPVVEESSSLLSMEQ